MKIFLTFLFPNFRNGTAKFWDIGFRHAEASTPICLIHISSSMMLIRSVSKSMIRRTRLKLVSRYSIRTISQDMLVSSVMDFVSWVDADEEPSNVVRRAPNPSTDFSTLVMEVSIRSCVEEIFSVLTRNTWHSFVLPSSEAIALSATSIVLFACTMAFVCVDHGFVSLVCHIP